VIHIGEIIRKEVESKRLTYKEFGAMIHRNEKTIPDIYERDSMSTDLLLTISGALKRDFLSYYYLEEPLKSLRNDDVARLSNEFQIYHEQIQKLTNENNQLKIELALAKELNEAQKVIISFAKDKIAGLESTEQLLRKEAEARH
jgi:plasmid maintenance system antidote protein VapI